jgi:hypothetical protein
MADQGDDEQETKETVKGETGKQTKDLDTVTDYVEGKEMARAWPAATAERREGGSRHGGRLVRSSSVVGRWARTLDARSSAV